MNGSFKYWSVINVACNQQAYYELSAMNGSVSNGTVCSMLSTEFPKRRYTCSDYASILWLACFQVAVG